MPLFLMLFSNAIASLREGSSFDQISFHGPAKRLVVMVPEYRASLCRRSLDSRSDVEPQ